MQHTRGREIENAIKQCVDEVLGKVKGGQVTILAKRIWSVKPQEEQGNFRQRCFQVLGKKIINYCQNRQPAVILTHVLTENRIIWGSEGLCG